MKARRQGQVTQAEANASGDARDGWRELRSAVAATPTEACRPRRACGLGSVCVVALGAAMAILARLGGFADVESATARPLEAGIDSDAMDRDAQDEIAILPVPIFGQGKLGNALTAWHSDRINRNSACSPMWEAGCYTTSRAMLYNYYRPLHTTPGLLNDCFADHDGYGLIGDPPVPCGIKWPPDDTRQPSLPYIASCQPSGTQLSERAHLQVVGGAAFWDGIDRLLRGRHPVMLAISAQSVSGYHMVVVKGRRHGNYVVNNPLNGGTEEEWPVDRTSGLVNVNGKQSVPRYYVSMKGAPPERVEWRVGLRLTPGDAGDVAGRALVRLVPRVGGSPYEHSGHVSVNSDGTTSPLLLIDPPTGQYDLFVHASGFLSEHTTVSVPFALNPVRIDAPLRAGDINTDDVVNALDLSMLIADLYSESARSDLNRDGIVNMIDHALLADNYLDKGALTIHGTPSDMSIMASAGEANGRMWIESSTTRPSVGQRAVFHIMADPSGADLDAGNITLNYDPGVLRYRTYTAGDLFEHVDVQSGNEGRPGSLTIGGHNTAGAASGRSGVIATVEFEVLSSIGATTVSIEHTPGHTADSNLAATGTSADVLAATQGITIGTSGPPSRARPTGRFTWPRDGVPLLLQPQTIVADVRDDFDQISRVEFTIVHDRGRDVIGTDSDGRDGWSILWNAVTYIPDGSGGLIPYTPQRFAFDARIYLRQTEIDAAVRSDFVQFALPQHDFNSLLVQVKPGRDIRQVVARHGGSGNDVLSDLGSGWHDVAVTHLTDWNQLPELMEEYLVDGDVAAAELNGIFYSWDDVVAGVSRSGVALTEGWNLVNLPATASERDMLARVNGLRAVIDRAYAFDPQDSADPWKRVLTAGEPAFNETTLLGQGTALWVHAPRSARIDMPLEPSDQRTVLQPGWNLIGAPGNIGPQAVADGLRAIEGRYALVYGLDGGIPGGRWRRHDPAREPADNSLTHLLPWRGYWINITTATTWPIRDESPFLTLWSLPKRFGAKERPTAGPSAARVLQRDAEPPEVPQLPMTVIGSLHGPMGAGDVPTVVAQVGDREIARARPSLLNSQWMFALDVAGGAGLGSDIGLRNDDLITIRAGLSFRPVHLRWHSGELAAINVYPFRAAPSASPGAPTPADPVPTPTARGPMATQPAEGRPASPAYLPALYHTERIRRPGRWRLLSPPSAPDTPRLIHDVAALAPDNAWAVGIDGLILHWNGSTWTPVDSPTREALRAVAFVHPADGWAVGGDRSSAPGIILHWNGHNWTTVDNPSTGAPGSVSVLSSTEAWVTGREVMRWDGRAWRIVPLPDGAFAGEVKAVGPGEAWSINADGTMLRFVGGGFHSRHTPVGHEDSGGWGAVDAVSPTDVWFGGSDGLFLQWNGSRFTEYECEGCAPRLQRYGVNDLKMTDRDDGWAITSGRIMHWDGKRWSKTEQFTDAMPRSPFVGFNMSIIRMSSATDGWIFAYSEVFRYEP